MIHIIGGGTFSHVRSHLSLSAMAFGKTARLIHRLHTTRDTANESMPINDSATLHLTKMADSGSQLVTNEDVAALVDKLVADPKTRVIYMNAALCDYDGTIMEEGFPGDIGTPSGKYAERLKTSDGPRYMMISPADKIISRIRQTRKDIFLVAFKTTSGATSDEQYLAGLNLLKANSANLVLANDVVTRNNMIIAPEETRYHESTDRGFVIRNLVEMVKARMTNTFTRSTVVPGDLVDFQTDAKVPDNLREVVNHLVQRGAYKPFRGATVGHFAVRVDDKRCLTSRRKTNYTEPHGLDLVEVEFEGRNKVIAHGAKPSVGGQSQRIVFDQHPDLDCIVHAHVPLRNNPRDRVPIADQWQNECGSMECGRNTSENLRAFADLKAVMLDDHGPNIVFGKNTPASKIIDFIEANFDLEAKTGGLVA